MDRQTDNVTGRDSPGERRRQGGGPRTEEKREKECVCIKEVRLRFESFSNM